MYCTNYVDPIPALIALGMFFAFGFGLIALGLHYLSKS